MKLKSPATSIPVLVTCAAIVTSFSPGHFANADANDCTSTCQDFTNGKTSAGAMSMQYAINNCGSPNGAASAAGAGTASQFAGQSGQTSGVGGKAGDLSQQPIDPNYNTGNGTGWDECYDALKLRWATVGPGCDAMALYVQGQTDEEIMAIVYGTAAAACGVACAFPALTIACNVTSVAAALGDIGFDISILENSAKLSSTAKWLSLASLGTGIGGAGTSISSSLFGQTDITQAGEAASEEELGDAGEDVIEETGSRTGSCITAGLMAMSVGFKLASFYSQKGAADAQCQNIKAAGYTGPFQNVYASASPTPSNITLAPSTALKTPISIQAIGKSGSGGSSGSSIPATAVRVVTTGRSFPPGIYAASTAGDIFGQGLSSIQNLANLPAQLQAAGVNTDALAKTISAGGSISQALSDSGFGKDLGSVGANLDKIEKAAEDGKLKLTDSAGKPYAQSAGGSSTAKTVAAKTNPFATFAMGSAVGGDATKETTFEKTKREIASTGGSDIWHEGFGGSIFQIVSSKLNESHERVDQLEWDTPLNRALMGLPARKGNGETR